MVKSALYEKLFGGKSGSGRYSGFHHFNLHMTGGKRKSLKGGEGSFLKLLNDKKKFLLEKY
jgi:hypothetical protein